MSSDERVQNVDYDVVATAYDQRSIDDIRALLVDGGFAAPTTAVAEHFIGAISVADAQAQGLLDRRSTSQFMVIDDEEYG